MMSLVVASKRTFGTAITNEQRRNQRKRSEGHASSFFENEENISNLNSAEFEFQINSTTKGSVEDMQKVVDKYYQNGDARNFPLR